MCVTKLPAYKVCDVINEPPIDDISFKKWFSWLKLFMKTVTNPYTTYSRDLITKMFFISMVIRCWLSNG